jgi:hypothetical protein
MGQTRCIPWELGPKPSIVKAAPRSTRDLEYQSHLSGFVSRSMGNFYVQKIWTGHDLEFD